MTRYEEYQLRLKIDQMSREHRQAWLKETKGKIKMTEAQDEVLDLATYSKGWKEGGATEVIKSLIKVQSDIGAIKKSKEVSAGMKFKYRGIEDVMVALHPLLNKYQLSVTTSDVEILHREIITSTKEYQGKESTTRMFYILVKVRYIIHSGIDGSTISTEVIAEGLDNGDKGTGKAMSYAFKNAMFSLFCVPTKETDDNERSNQQIPPKQVEKTSTLAPKIDNPVKVEKVLRWIDKAEGEEKSVMLQTKETLLALGHTDDGERHGYLVKTMNKNGIRMPEIDGVQRIVDIPMNQGKRLLNIFREELKKKNEENATEIDTI